MVTSFDVLYHLNVDDDRAALDEIHRVLRPGGIALIRLPAFDWIRGAHDEVVHTRHRYTRDELSGKLEDAGFRLEHATYANFLLFPMAPAKRYLERRQGSREATDLWRPPGPINRLLADLLSLEAMPGPGHGSAVGAVRLRRRPPRSAARRVASTGAGLASWAGWPRAEARDGRLLAARCDARSDATWERGHPGRSACPGRPPAIDRRAPLGTAALGFVGSSRRSWSSRSAR